MKIAYVANSRFPSEKAQSDQIMAMCSALAFAGHEVRLFVPDRRPLVHEDPFYYYGRARTFTVERIPCLDGLRVSWLGVIGYWIQAWSFLRTARRRVRAFGPEAIYSRDLYFFIGLRSSASRVWESHALPRSGRWAWLLRRLSGIVALTAASRDRLRREGVAAENILVEPDAVDLSLFEGAPSRDEARRVLGMVPDECVCVYTGKFTTMGMPKGLDEALKAVRQLRGMGKPIRLLAVGGTPEELHRYATESGDGISFLGHVPQRDLKRFYAAADLLLMPFPWTEHYAYFMSPLKLFEYMASGVPMVVTDLPSVREIIGPEEAFIAKPGDPVSLAHVIDEAWASPEARYKKARTVKALVARYTWDERAKRIAAFLSDRRRFGALIVTQVMDRQDANLGFFVSWIERLASMTGRPLHVACWSQGDVSGLPSNVILHQMPRGAAQRSLALLVLSWRLRHSVSSVFVHMIPPVVVAVGWWWRLLSWRVTLWYTHGSVTPLLRIATWFVHVILTASEESFRIATPKKNVIGHGIDLDLFRPGIIKRASVLLTVGRITPRKNLESLIDLCLSLRTRFPDLLFRVQIVGEPRTKDDQAYLRELRSSVERHALDRIVCFEGAATGEALIRFYQQAALFVSTSRTGSLDKAVLEALACGTPVIATGAVYSQLLGVYGTHFAWDEAALHYVERALRAPQEDPSAREGVRDHADVQHLVRRLADSLFLN